MVFNKRERLVAIVTLLCVGLFVFDRYALTPYLDLRARLDADRQAAVHQLDQARRLFANQTRLEHAWRDMLAQGLGATPSESESRVLHAVRDWAQDAGVELTSLKPERTAQEGRFEQISFHASGTGGMAAIARVLWRLETASLPLRVNLLQITPRKEATDDLTVQLSISTLCLNPEPEKPKPRPVTNEGRTP